MLFKFCGGCLWKRDKFVSLGRKNRFMASSTKNKPVQQAAPATGQQPITSGTQTIQRPTTNTSTDRALKEGKE